MKKQLFKNKYPLKTLEIKKDLSALNSASEIMNFFQKKVEAYPIADFIAIFDHLKQTQNMEGGVVSPDIKYAQAIIFCFGKKLENPLQMGVRPRSIGVVETDDLFVVSFLEAPNPMFNDLMEEWCDELTV